MFNRARLRIARLFHGLTQRQLAERVAVSNGLIATFESGDKEPKDEILDALCSVLGVERAYFAGAVDELLEGESNFRRRITAPEILKRRVLARGSLFGMAVHHLSQFGKFPAFDFPNLPAFSLEDVETIAERSRLHWKLGIDAPIGDVARVIENAGAIILSIDLKTAEKVDAFSRFGIISVVVLNSQKHSPSRTLFDMAHEIGHGIMHQSNQGLSLDRREEEADRFAGAFLMPRDAFTADFLASRPSDWDGLLDMKRHWRASIQAILVRARQLGLIDAAEFRTRFRTLSGWGWRKSEPDEPSVDSPTLFAKAIDLAYRDFGKTPADIAAALAWSPDLFESVTGVCVNAPTVSGSNIISLTERRRMASA